MFQMRQEHMLAFDHAVLERFVRLADADLRHSYPDRMASLPTEEMRAFILRSIDAAAEYGLETEYAILCFSHIQALLGEDFEEDPRNDCLLDLLTDSSDDENERAKWALEYVQERIRGFSQAES